MTLRFWRFLALMAAVNATLNRYFAIIDGAYQVGSIGVAGVLSYVVRRRAATFRWTLAGAVLLALAFVVCPPAPFRAQANA